MNVHLSRNKTSFWRSIISEPLCILIPDIFIIRPIRYIFNCYIKSAKFFIINLPRSIWARVRRNETICCLIGFGIGVGCCILYRLISNFLTPSTNTNSSINSQREVKSSLPSVSTKVTRPKREHLINTKHDYDDYIRTNNISDDMTWSEMSSSLSTLNLLHDSYHSNSLTGDSGVDCPEVPIRNHSYDDDNEHEIILKKYDSEHPDTHNESHVMSYISTEKGLERALEQTSRFYTDLEHIAIDLQTLTKRYSPPNRAIDALDWDGHDDIPSPKPFQRKAHQQLNRLNNKNKIRRRLNATVHQIEYHESDHNNRVFDYSTSPIRRKHSSVYFDSTDTTSDEENFGDETLQLNS